MISTLGGLFDLNHFDQSSRANDVIVIQHKDGSLHSTPFNVRFGRAQMWHNAGRVVQVEVNGTLTSAVMKIGKGGEAYWLQPTYGAFGAETKGGKDAKNTTAGENVTQGNRSDLRTEAARTKHALTNDDGLTSLGSAGSSSGYDDNPTLTIDQAELQQYPIHPESPPEVPHERQASPPSPPQRRPGGTTASTQQEVQNTPPHELSRSGPGSSDSVANLPLLHRADDGHLTVETRAIHSAGDAQEARLALRAMAAAEKSRRRLSKLLLTEDPFFLQSAQAEGQLATDTSNDEDEDEVVMEGSSPTHRGSHSDGGEDAQAAAAATQTLVTPTKAGTTSPPAVSERHSNWQNEGEAAVPSSVASPACVLPPAPTTPSSASAAHVVAAPARTATAAATASRDRAEVASGGSRSGSSDSDKMEDADDYFLEPIDADDYVAMYGEEELLRNVSFASSVTSGVSLTEAVMSTGGDGGSAAAFSSAKSPLGISNGERDLSAARAAGGGSSSSPRSATKAATPAQQTKPAKPTNKDSTSAQTSPVHAAKPSPPAAAPPRSNANLDEGSDMVDAEGRPVHPATAAAHGPGGGPYFTRTLIPVEADLWKLHLTEGCNKVRYLARKDKGEVVSVACNIFLWNWTDRLVVSDVDGTITKSDLLGHFYAMLGKGADWTHPGICNLYSKIERNGYHMVYLTARSVSQINQTKTYLFTLQQDGVGLPLGPVLTAPQRFFTALTQEVSKQSHVFKIACLTSVRAAFPPHTKPFFAGFGNRYNDVISYDAVSIPTHKIFIIDPSSVLHVCLVKQTYRDLGHLVDVTFPPLKRTPLVQRGPRHPRRPGDPQVKHNKPHNDTQTRASTAADRHAYAHGLLHRSSSASSSSSSCSSSASSDCSTDFNERSGGTGSGSGASSEYGGSGDAWPHAQPTAGHHAPHHHQHHHHHHHTPDAGEMHDGMPTRHASAAFSLVDSFRVSVSGEEAAVQAATEHPVSATSRKVGPPLSPARGATTTTITAPTSSAAFSDRTDQSGAATAVSRAASSQSVNASAGCEGFSGPASPHIGITYPATAATQKPAASSSASPQPRLPPAALSNATADLTASHAANASASLPKSSNASMGPATPTATATPATGAATAVPPSSGGGRQTFQGSRCSPKYNYGQRSGHGSSCADGCLPEEEEDVTVDPDFSSFAYWRMDPRDLIAKPAAPAAAAVKSKSGNARSAPATTSPSGTGSAVTTSAAAATSRDVLVSEKAAALAARDNAALKDALGKGNTVTSDGQLVVKDAAEEPKATPAAVGESSPAKTSSTNVPATAGSVRAPDVNPPVPLSLPLSPPLPPSSTTPPMCSGDSTAVKSPIYTGSPLSDRPQQQQQPHNSPSLTDASAEEQKRHVVARKDPPVKPLEASAPSASTATAPAESVAMKRSFFSAFGFGYGKTANPAPPPMSPGTARAKQAREEAQRKALAHPDALEYYRVLHQQQQPEEQAVSDGESLRKAAQQLKPK